jgi:hypothetical protein
MWDGYNPISRLPDTLKTGITLHINQGEQRDPLEVTVFFKKPDKGAEDNQADAVSLKSKGKLTLALGRIGSIELFAEQTVKLDDGFTEGEEG